ncbi:Protein NYNRIN, partial [Mucuna pruriens]
MRFGLKNAGATYQCLIDRIFKGLIGDNIEVYVDDMMMKSTIAVNHCEALEECSKEVPGHHQHEESADGQGGVAVDREDHCALAFPILVDGDNRPHIQHPQKGDSFSWKAESEEAFLRMKALSHPLILTKPVPGIPLLIYISIAKDAIIAAIVQERGGKQHPIYFISKVLQDAEMREGIPRPSDRISKTVPLLSRAFDNHKDGPANQVSTQEARLGRTDGVMECPII